MLVNFITHAIHIVVALSCIFPVFWMVSSSLKSQEEIYTTMKLLPAHPNWANYIEAWVRAEFGQYFLNSAIYTVVGVFGIVFISSLAAYGFARLIPRRSGKHREGENVPARMVTPDRDCPFHIVLSCKFTFIIP
jgi:ABC-type glycerol-3-phosphate transport system permease component